MKRKITAIALMVILIFAVVTLAACHKAPEEKTIINDIVQDEISMTVSATAEQVNIKISSEEEVAGNATVDVVRVKAYEYLDVDPLKGLSANILSIDDAVKNRAVGVYKLGTEQSLTLSRFTNDVDSLYDKYYVVGDGRILKGPIYATDIEAENNATPQLDIKSKKGLLGEDVSYFKDLNCSYATLNFEIEDLVYPNEMFENGEEIELAHPNDAIAFVSNNKTYYFNRERVAFFDARVKEYYSFGAHVTAIIYAKNKGANPETFPSKMTYLPWSTAPVISSPPSLLGLNTSNSYGKDYFVAIMEFLASRYTHNDLANGYIANFVIGNEIDYARDYNRISEHHAELDVYMEEYSRLLRLANLAVKKYDSRLTVNMPITQSWNSRGYEDASNRVQAYTPKLMVDWLNTKSKLEGDYNWGIAPHCYTYGLALPNVFENDTINGRNVGMNNNCETTTKLTFSNIELLDMYLNQSKMQCNGTTRSLWLTEQGVSTYQDTEEERNIQAGTIAAIWYKLSQIDSIKSFSYYRLFDHSSEAAGGARFGLVDANREQKPSYEVYKYIDTQYSEYVAKDYLQYLKYVDGSGKEHSVSNGEIKSYMDLLDVFETGWLKTDYDWEKATPVTAPTVYEWEDKIDLSGVTFESANYLYDGTAKHLQALNLPEGVSVSYDVEPTLTNVGTITVIATFTKDGEWVGHRKATLSIGRLSTNKSVYNYGEKIFVTADVTEPTLQRTAWIGIFKKGAVPGNTAQGEMSYYYYYPNKYSDSYKRTECLQDYPNPDSKWTDLQAGKYVIYYFVDGGYNYFYGVEIEVLSKNDNSGTVDLSDVKFESAQLTYDGSAQSLEITGTLPVGVSVEYINNTANGAGVFEAVAVFKKEGKELERRYAVLTVLDSDFQMISTNKTVYFEGETVMVTAYAPASAEPNTWWVGLYLENEEDYQAVGSIYFYYVYDDNHVPNVAYDISKQIHNSARPEYAKLPVGSYKVVLFNTEGYTEETYTTFEVVEWDSSAEEGTLSVDKTNFAVGEAINVTATKKTDSTAIYTVGILKASAESKMSNIIYSYLVVDGTHVSGETYDISNETLIDVVQATLVAGQYKIVLFVGNGVGSERVLQTVQIQIGSDEEQPTVGTLYTNKTEYAEGESIYVTAYIPDSDTSWWVGIYLADEDNYAATTSIFWYYVGVKSSSGSAFNISLGDLGGRPELESIPAGSYRIVLFNTTGYTEETHVIITVASATDDAE